MTDLKETIKEAEAYIEWLRLHNMPEDQVEKYEDELEYMYSQLEDREGGDY